MEEHEVRKRLQSAFQGLQTDYVGFGGWQPRNSGYLDEDDAAFPGYVGGFAWSEADIQHRFANHLTEQFRALETSGQPSVHIGLPIRVGTRDDLEKNEAGTWPAQQHIDIVVTDPSRIPNGEGVPPSDRGRAFRSQQHLAFIEVKWFHKGSKHWEKHNWKAKVEKGVQPDLDRLGQHLAKGRCLVAAMLLVDDTGAYLDRYDELAWPVDVLQLSVDQRTATQKAD